MANIILIRHGQSEWNAKNLFTGWVDAQLSSVGKKEAKLSGSLIKNLNIKFTHGFTSFLARARDTLTIIKNTLDDDKIIINAAWELNERHYGSLTGLNKLETKQKLGEKVFNSYRRSWNICPPPIELDNKHILEFSKLNSSIPLEKVPLTESLKDTFDRVIPFYKNKIFPQIKLGRNVLIAAHGNSLRALCKHLLNISDKKINILEIPTGNPLLIKLNSNLSKTLKVYYLDEIRKKKIFFNE